MSRDLGHGRINAWTTVPKDPLRRFLMQPIPQQPTAMTHKPKFYDIADYVVDDYDEIGYIPSELSDEVDERTRDYIIRYNLQTGDVIFTGSTYETRQEYGFYMVDRSEPDLLISNEGYYGVEDEDGVREVTNEYAELAGVSNLDFTDVNEGVINILKYFGSI